MVAPSASRAFTVSFRRPDFSACLNSSLVWRSIKLVTRHLPGSARRLVSV
jgi:hypothetical protein